MTPDPDDRPQEKRRFPIGQIQDLPTRDAAALLEVAARMEDTGRDWREMLSGLDTETLARSYRPGGWTVAQLAHHAAEAHMHGLNRLRYGLTTEGYVIQPFDQDAWLALPDAALPLGAAFDLLDTANLHWGALLRGVQAEQFARRVTHPREGEQDLWRLVAKHDWHLRHHLAHARLALEG